MEAIPISYSIAIPISYSYSLNYIQCLLLHLNCKIHKNSICESWLQLISEIKNSA